MASTINLSQVVQKSLSLLEEKEKEVVLRHFGIGNKERESLASIGKEWGITRERVRQIKDKALEKIRKNLPEKEKVFSLLRRYFEKFGGVRKEESLLNDWGNEILLFLALEGDYQRMKETKEFFTFWIERKESLERIKNLLVKIIQFLDKIKTPQKINSLVKEFKIEKEKLESILEISKILGKDKEGRWGLKSWPEIRPRGLKDKAYLVFKEVQKPLHFTELAKLIPGAKVESLHNELIKDPRFVLIGRGIYALREWGYIPGEVKDVILQILKEKGRPMTKEEILREIQKQRIVKPMTVFLNLSNKNYFEKDEKGRYRPKTAEI